MVATVELTPDQLAQLVALVFESNGFNANGLALYLDGQLVGYDRVVVHCEMDKDIKVFPKPQVSMTRKQINEILYSDGSGSPGLIAAGN